MSWTRGWMKMGRLYLKYGELQCMHVCMHAGRSLMSLLCFCHSSEGKEGESVLGGGAAFARRCCRNQTSIIIQLQRHTHQASPRKRLVMITSSSHSFLIKHKCRGYTIYGERPTPRFFFEKCKCFLCPPMPSHRKDHYMLFNQIKAHSQTLDMQGGVFLPIW